MNTLPTFPRRWRERRKPTRHSASIADILDTPPILPKPDGVVLYSMIGTAELLPYLVAIKSFWRHLQRGRVAILDDGTLTAQDRAILAYHCGDPEFLAREQIDTARFPAVDSWRCLLAILDRRGSEYWIQLGNDTVTLGPLTEVTEAIAANHSFILAGNPATCAQDPGQVQVQTLGEFVRHSYPDGPAGCSNRAQIESRLGKIARKDWLYVNGGTGLSGFAAGGPGRRLALALLAQIHELVGDKALSQTGIEQIATNFLIANEPRSAVLPAARFAGDCVKRPDQNSVFVRFSAEGAFGASRFAENDYVLASRKAIDHLNS